MQTLDGSEPHPDYGGWANFLAMIEVRDTFCTKEGNVVYYGSTNCNYVLLPNGYIVENYGYHGRSLMASIRQKGWRRVWNDFKAAYDEMQTALQPLARQRPLSK